MKRVLILANHRKDRSPGQRFRFEQYLDFLEKNGFQCELSFLLDQKEDKLFYSKGNWIAKFFLYLKCLRKRKSDIKRLNDFNLVFVHREAFFTGTTKFERAVKQSGVKMIFDFDDSIWLANVSNANKKLEWLKNYDKTRELITLADMVFAGNQYLANYAAESNNNVQIVPTTIDTEEYERIPSYNHKICIGWSGSITTIQHFEFAIPFLKELKSTYGDRIEIKVIGDANYTNTELGIQGIAWSKKDEIKELSSFDIGIMPLPNDEWTKGKCGLKGLQYMALEIPTIMSPVGVNSEIIEDGKNGYLAESTQEWIDKLTSLIETESLRKEMGKRGRETVVNKYSVTANRDAYLKAFQRLSS